MLQKRVIPCLLLEQNALVKTVRFNDPVYIGDPLNTITIFSEYMVDELIILDITDKSIRPKPNMDIIGRLASYCTTPLTYGGGISSLDDIATLIRSGVEKVSLNTICFKDPAFISQAAAQFGSQSIVVSMDVKQEGDDYRVYANGGKDRTEWNPVEYGKNAQSYGAGELLVNSVDRDGTMEGYDRRLMQMITSAVSLPVIASGGAKDTDDISKILDTEVSAAAAGALFVFQSKDSGVLIHMPIQPR